MQELKDMCKLKSEQIDPNSSREGEASSDSDSGDGELMADGCEPGHGLKQTPQRSAQRDSSDLPCVFCDITHMGGQLAKCVTHGSECYVPSVDVLLVGTSCKDLSKANPNKAKQKNVLSQASSRGGSAQTFRGLLAYLDAQRPPLIVFENVDSLLEAENSSQSGSSSNMEVLKREFENRGYQAQATVCEASKFGLPARRRRLYMFFVQMVGNNLVDFSKRPVCACFAQFRSFLATCMRDSPSLPEVLLPEEDAAVQAELFAREGKHRDPATMASVGSAEWPEAHMKFAQSLGVVWSKPAGPHLQNNPWYHTLNAREKNALPLLQAQMPAKLSMVRDLSQSIARANVQTWQEDVRRHVGPTLLSRMVLWLENHKDPGNGRIMLGREALVLQGFPARAFLNQLQQWRPLQDMTVQGPLAGSVKAKAPTVTTKPVVAAEGSQDQDKRPLAGTTERPPAGFPTEALMADLAGNGMALPVLLAFLQSALACIEWKDAEQVGPVPRLREVSAACAAVELLQGGAEAVEQDVRPRGLFKKMRRS